MPTTVGYVCAVLLLTVYMFVFEIVSVDVTAIAIWSCLAPQPLAPYLGLDAVSWTTVRFCWLWLNAVISIIAVMIIGAGLDKPA